MAGGKQGIHLWFSQGFSRFKNILTACIQPVKMRLSGFAGGPGCRNRCLDKQELSSKRHRLIALNIQIVVMTTVEMLLVIAQRQGRGGFFPAVFTKIG